MVQIRSGADVRGRPAGEDDRSGGATWSAARELADVTVMGDSDHHLFRKRYQTNKELDAVSPSSKMRTGIERGRQAARDSCDGDPAKFGELRWAKKTKKNRGKSPWRLRKHDTKLVSLLTVRMKQRCGEIGAWGSGLGLRLARCSSEGGASS